jgi:hypothetical protein
MVSLLTDVTLDSNSNISCQVLVVTLFILLVFKLIERHY